MPAPALESSAAPADADLLRRVAGGDVDAFGSFYDRHAPLLFALSLKILRDPHEAEDALQEAMVLLWERAPAYDPTLGKPLSWAVALTRNKAIDRLRSVQRKHRLVVESVEAGEMDPPAEAASPPSATQDDAFALMRRELARLPAEQRQAIELAFYSGLTHSEIAEQLGQPLGTIKARIRRGMITLRDALGDLL